ncbi:MAG: RnfABCDGE type electron transport complex subunit G [Bacteroidales bacterium]|nr:RnfABCDGE type electron transport complex subunit G [Bacteroidales bacterium]
MVLCLFTVCLACSSVLAAVYVVTKAPIDKAAAAKTTKAIALVVPDFDSDPEESAVSLNGQEMNYYTVRKNGEIAGYAIESTTSGFGGPLTLMVGVTPDGKVYNTSVLVCNETPGLGAKCLTDKAFINQFKNLDPAVEHLSVKKDGGDVDAITASTITSRAYTLAISNAVEAFKNIKGE